VPRALEVLLPLPPVLPREDLLSCDVAVSSWLLLLVADAARELREALLLPVPADERDELRELLPVLFSPDMPVRALREELLPDAPRGLRDDELPDSSPDELREALLPDVRDELRTLASPAPELLLRDALPVLPPREVVRPLFSPDALREALLLPDAPERELRASLLLLLLLRPSMLLPRLLESL
jgi:hypothetical protein